MEHNIVLAGVGGQGILTIARGLSIAALGKGMHVKQAEVHGMSQRGGAVYSHLRISSSEIFSDMIPMGEADMILAIEPLEALRYAEMLKPNGTVIASTNAVTNIGNYPPIESVLDHLVGFPNHVAISMLQLARAAGSTMTANTVAMGAASLFLGFTVSELEGAIRELFAAKGERVVDANLRAFRFGRTAAAAYVDGLQRGGSPKSVRQWIETLSPEHLASEDALDATGLLTESLVDFLDATGLPLDATGLLTESWGECHGREDRLSGAEAHAFESILMNAYEEGRRRLYEHEVYSLVELVGAISPPRYSFVPKGSMIPREALEQYPGDTVVVKLVSPEIVHKTDAHAVAFVPKTIQAVRTEIDRLIERHTGVATVAGALVVEFVENKFRGFGGELFVGIRATREFGPVIAAGLGGLDTEYLATKMRPGVAVAKAVAMDTDAETFLERFMETAAYDILAGKARGHERRVSDGELLRCFRAFIAIARGFCVDRGEEGPDIGELEVNPFAFRNQRLIPLDGRGWLQTAAKAAPARPKENVRKMLEPDSISLIGVSSKPDSIGRIILGNILQSGFPKDKVTVVKKDVTEIDGVRCVPDIADLPEPVDLLVISTASKEAPSILSAVNSTGKARAAIIISGGGGETEDSHGIGEEIREAIREGRQRPDGGCVVLGPNCMGIQSRPGGYDTFFIPKNKMARQDDRPAQPVAILSQSGAFIVSRLSSLEHLRPAFTISIGNQADVTVSDLLWALHDRPDVQVIGVYVEGFANLDGLETLRAVSQLAKSGKTVVFYKAGRTEAGRLAAAGHTAAVAGDYDICQSAMHAAGAIVVENFREFNQSLETATLLADRTARGNRVFAVTNAGMEAVSLADTMLADGATAQFADLSDSLREELRSVISRRNLGGIVDVRNPMDLTPMADEAVYDEIVRAALKDDGVDAVIVSCVPLAPELRTLESQLGDPAAFPSLCGGWQDCGGKPILFVCDAGPLFDPLASAVRAAGLPVFRAADEAILALGAWLNHRLAIAPVPQPAATT